MLFFQDKREDLKRYISGLTNCDSMSQDNQRVLKMMIRDLMQGYGQTGRPLDLYDPVNLHKA